MSNYIEICKGSPSIDYIAMSNGLTDVFINVISLSGSFLAHTIDEKRLIVWLLEKDQAAVGMGTVGFDICEMPWNIKAFDENKQFLINVIQAAEDRMGWEKLRYTPNEELLFPRLRKFKELISKIKQSDINPNALDEWLDAAELDDPILNGFPRCIEHDTLLTCFGCQICRN